MALRRKKQMEGEIPKLEGMLMMFMSQEQIMQASITDVEVVKTLKANV